MMKNYHFKGKLIRCKLCKKQGDRHGVYWQVNWGFRDDEIAKESKEGKQQWNISYKEESGDGT